MFSLSCKHLNKRHHLLPYIKGLYFSRESACSSESVYATCILSQAAESGESLLGSASPTFSHYRSRLTAAIPVGVYQQLLEVLFCIFLMTNDGEYVFMCFLDHSYIFFDEVSAEIFLPVSYWIVRQFFMCILDTRP